MSAALEVSVARSEDAAFAIHGHLYRRPPMIEMLLLADLTCL
jgi:hypothetical protein